MAEITEITDQNFETEVLQSDTLTLVDFWAEWCAPCRAISPILKDLADVYAGRLKIVKLNVEEHQASPSTYAVRALPTILFFKEGTVVEQVTGARPKASFVEVIEKHLA